MVINFHKSKWRTTHSYNPNIVVTVIYQTDPFSSTHKPHIYFSNLSKKLSGVLTNTACGSVAFDFSNVMFNTDSIWSNILVEFATLSRLVFLFSASLSSGKGCHTCNWIPIWVNCIPPKITLWWEFQSYSNLEHVVLSCDLYPCQCVRREKRAH